MIRRIPDAIPLPPDTIRLTVSVNPAPPIIPPANAPSIMPYTGGTFKMINTIAITSPATAPNVLIVAIIYPHLIICLINTE